MSVRTGDRDEGKLTVIEASKNLIAYTYDRVHDKTLPKSDRWLMSKTIWGDASAARALIIRANAIRVENKADAEERLLLEKISIGHLDSLAASIDTLHVKEKISDERCAYWTGLVTTTENLLKGLLKANRQAYKKYLTE